MTEPYVGGASAAPLSMRDTAVVASAIIRAARQLFTDLERGRRIDATALRDAMEVAFGTSDANGAWNWKTAPGTKAKSLAAFDPRALAHYRAFFSDPAQANFAVMRKLSAMQSSIEHLSWTVGFIAFLGLGMAAWALYHFRHW